MPTPSRLVSRACVAIALVDLLVACVPTHDWTICDPGEVRSCPCEGGEGRAVCAGRRPAWGACACPAEVLATWEPDGNAAAPGAVQAALASGHRLPLPFDFGVPAPLAPLDGPLTLATGDLDADGVDDALALVPGDPGALVVGTAAAGGPLVWRRVATDLVEPTALAVADLDADGQAEAIVFERTTGAIRVFERQDAALYPAMTLVRHVWAVADVKVADVDEDGDADLVAARNRVDGEGLVWLEQVAPHAFDVHVIDALAARVTGVALGDVDGDGHLDLLAGTARDGAWLYHGEGTGEFTRLHHEDVRAPRTLALEDADGDGDVDALLVSEGDTEVRLLENLGGGRLVPRTIPVGAPVRDARLRDLDADGRPDLLLALEDEVGVVVLLGREGLVFARRWSQQAFGPRARLAVLGRPERPEETVVLATSDEGPLRVARQRLGPQVACAGPESMGHTEEVPARDLARVRYAGGWQAAPLREPGIGESRMTATTPGATALFRFEGTSVSVVLVTGYDGGLVRYAIDGVPRGTLSSFGRGRGRDLYFDVGSESYRELLLATALPAGPHTVTLTLTGAYDPERFAATSVDNDPASAALSLVAFRSADGPCPFASVEGVAWDAHTVRLPGASVALRRGGALVATLVTGDDGAFSASGLPEGDYEAHLAADGYAPRVIPVVLRAGETSTLTARLASGPGNPLWGRVFYPSTGVPAIVAIGGALAVEYEADERADGFVATLWRDGHPVRGLPIAARYLGESRWVLDATLPPDLAPALYDLAVRSSAAPEHVQPRAVKAVAELRRDFRFAVLDSLQMDWDTLHLLAAELATRDLEFVVFTGDNIRNPRTPAIAATRYGQVLHALRVLDLPTFLVPGNHDLGSAGEVRVTRVWQQLVGKRYHAFQYGDVHFQALDDATCQRLRMELVDPEQLAWARADLEAHRGDAQRIVFRHIVKNGFYPVFWPDWEWQGGLVDMVFYGHYGKNEAIDRRGTVYVQTADVQFEGWFRVVRVVDGRVVGYDRPESVY